MSLLSVSAVRETGRVRCVHGMGMEGGEDRFVWGCNLGFAALVKMSWFLSFFIILFFHPAFMSVTYVPLYTTPEL